MRDAGQVGCRTGGKQDRWDAGLVGCMTGGLPDWREAGNVAQPKLFISGSGSTFFPYFGSSSSHILPLKNVLCLYVTVVTSNIKKYVSMEVDISLSSS